MVEVLNAPQKIIDTWLHSFCPEILSWAELGSYFKNTAIQTCQFHPNDHPGSGIVLTTEIDSQVCEFLQAVNKERTERIIVIIVREPLSPNDNPWQALQAGASDLLFWNRLADPASVILEKFSRWRDVDDLLDSPLIRNSLVGQSHAWKTVLRQIIEVARYTDDSIVLIGETGTGKELAARLIHTLDQKRKKHDLVIQDCTTIVGDLSGSELFGHERGAFTGAVAARDGAFALADGGTLFLDEVGELPIKLQIQLLRVLQEHTYKRVGSNVWRNADFRLICATNRDLNVEQAHGEFRKDLYYRIAHWVIRMPPLRERFEDIILLVQHFIRQARPDLREQELDDNIRKFFLTREYSGNIRDLKNLVFRIAARHIGLGPITVGDIPTDERPVEETTEVGEQLDFDVEQPIRRALASGLGFKEIRKIVEETTIRVALDGEEGNLQRAAKVLDVTDRALQKRRADQLKHMRSVVD